MYVYIYIYIYIYPQGPEARERDDVQREGRARAG